MKLSGDCFKADKQGKTIGRPIILDQELTFEPHLHGPDSMFELFVSYIIASEAPLKVQLNKTRMGGYSKAKNQQRMGNKPFRQVVCAGALGRVKTDT